MGIKIILQEKVKISKNIAKRVNDVKKELFKLIKKTDKNLKVAFETNTNINGSLIMYIKKIDNMFVDYDEYEDRHAKKPKWKPEKLLSKDKFIEYTDVKKPHRLIRPYEDGLNNDLYLSNKAKNILMPVVKYMDEYNKNFKYVGVGFNIEIGNEDLDDFVDEDYK